jgi:aspartyl/asparaginyl-tRNA synthetase
MWLTRSLCACIRARCICRTIGICAGECSSSEYPLQKKRHSLEFLRTIAHLRPRTNIIGAVMRVRSALAQATHAFFSQHGFLYVHTPIISTADCEGAGEMFQVRLLQAHDIDDSCAIAYLHLRGHVSGHRPRARL